jgi:hypothetical protein
MRLRRAFDQRIVIDTVAADDQNVRPFAALARNESPGSGV